MHKILYSLAVILTIAGLAKATDNYVATQGSGKTFRCVEITGSICIPTFTLADSTGQLIGTTASPVGVSDAGVGSASDSVCGTATGTCSLTALLKFNNNANTSAIPAGTNTIGTVGWLPYPVGATAITASATGTGVTTATLAGTSGKTTYICSMSIRSNATAAATGIATVTGTITGTLNFTHWTAPTPSGLGVTEMIFNPCVPASATNTGIAIVSPAPGTGGTASSTGSGFQL